MKMYFRVIALITTLITMMAASTAAHATAYNFSYNFLDGKNIAGSFMGDINSTNNNLIKNISNLTATYDGYNFSFNDDYYNNNPDGSDLLIISINGRENSFDFYTPLTNTEFYSSDSFIALYLNNTSSSDGDMNFSNWHVTAANAPGSGTVPEPETYAMLLTGLGLMGFMVRRRKTS